MALAGHNITEHTHTHTRADKHHLHPSVWPWSPVFALNQLVRQVQNTEDAQQRQELWRKKNQNHRGLNMPALYIARSARMDGWIITGT